MWKRFIDLWVKVMKARRKIVPVLKRVMKTVFGKTEGEQEQSLKEMMDLLKRTQEEYDEYERHSQSQNGSQNGSQMIEEEAPPAVVEPARDKVKEEAEKKKEEEDLERGCWMSDPFSGGV